MIDHQFYSITAGSYAYVPQDTIHQFKNIGSIPLKFICIVPEMGHQ
jgi:mannose-6-phosphate isomerase-like protein (cupin superfamily)